MPKLIDVSIVKQLFEPLLVGKPGVLPNEIELGMCSGVAWYIAIAYLNQTLSSGFGLLVKQQQTPVDVSVIQSQDELYKILYTMLILQFPSALYPERHYSAQFYDYLVASEVVAPGLLVDELQHAYFNKDGLTCLLSLLESKALQQPSGFRFAMILGSSDHRICIGYSNDSKKWLYGAQSVPLLFGHSSTLERICTNIFKLFQIQEYSSAVWWNWYLLSANPIFTRFLQQVTLSDSYFQLLAHPVRDRDKICASTEYTLQRCYYLDNRIDLLKDSPFIKSCMTYSAVQREAHECAMNGKAKLFGQLLSNLEPVDAEDCTELLDNAVDTARAHRQLAFAEHFEQFRAQEFGERDDAIRHARMSMRQLGIKARRHASLFRPY